MILKNSWTMLGLEYNELNLVIYEIVEHVFFIFNH